MSRKANVLVIDEEPSVGASIQAALADGGHTVKVALSEADALRALIGPFDVLFLHCRLPHSTCDEIVRHARTHAEPSIVLTASGSTSAAEKDKLRLAADGIISRPIDPEDVRTIVQGHVNAAQAPRDVPVEPCILVVDDQDIVLLSVQDILKNRYQVVGTKSPLEALQLLKESPFEILLTDLMMPEMSGTDLIRAAKNCRPSILAIVMTGYASKDAAVASLKEGAYDFLEKPLVPDVVRRTVTRAWKSQRTGLENLKLLAGLCRANKELSSKISHELKNPLNSIGASFYYVRSSIPEDAIATNPKISKHCDIIETQIDRSKDIIETMRGLEEQRPESYARIDVNDLLRDSIPLAVSSEAKVDIQFDLDPALPLVKASAPQLQQAFINLMVNATQAMSGNGVLTIKTEGDSQRNAVISFTDTGAGLPVEIVDRIFDPFFTTKQPDEGTGLGLSITHGIVTEHGGTITAGNADEGGAVFTITLPQTQHAEALAR